MYEFLRTAPNPPPIFYTHTDTKTLFMTPVKSQPHEPYGKMNEFESRTLVAQSMIMDIVGYDPNKDEILHKDKNS